MLTSCRRFVFPAVLSAVLALGTAVYADETSDRLRADTQAMAGVPSYDAGGVDLAAVTFIPAFYAARDYRPAWYQSDAGSQLGDAISSVGAHGLSPEDFHAAKLVELANAAASGDPAAVAIYDLVATDAAARLLHHLYFGKVDAEQLDPDWNFNRPVVDGNVAWAVSDAVDRGAFDNLVDRVVPNHPQYRRLQEALRTYSALAAAGGWLPIDAGERLKPGADDPRVPELRDRLRITGDLTTGATGPLGTVYDPTLEVAVKRFQDRHGLDADGVVGAKTFNALNVPVEERIEQIKISLERARWIVQGLGDDFVLVNIAGARTYLVRGGEVVWQTRSITGQPYRKTPVFRDEIQYMEFNPTWTVPRSIFLKDKLAKIRQDRGYLSRGNYVVRNSDGRTLDPASVDWSGKPAVTLVQQPGPKNALGLVKFMFPNKYAVYLHDTDDRSLFERAERNLSSGCVRVEDPFVFADLLMQDDPSWTAARRDDILASRKTTRIDLPRPMPVLLTYWTAWVAGETIHFRDDVYGRDAFVAAALQRAFAG